MAKVTIDNLPIGTPPPLDGSEIIPLVRSGRTKNATLAELPISDAVQAALDLKGDASAVDVLEDFRVWDATRTYALNEPTFRNGQPYRSLIASNLNKDPETNPTDWELVGGGAGGGSKNFVKNTLNSANIADWTRSAGTALSWSTATPISGGGALLISTLTTGQTVDGLLNTVDPIDGGQSWKIDIGYYIDAGATYTDGQLSLVLLDGATEISGGNVPIVLGQVNTTSVYVYPTTNLAGLKVRLKCSGGTGTVRLAGVSVAPQQILSVPAIGGEYASLFTLSGFTGTLSAGSTVGRVGNRLKGCLRYAISTVSGSMGVILPATLTTQTLSYGDPQMVSATESGVAVRQGMAVPTSATLISIQNPTGTNYGPTTPHTWDATDFISIDIDLPISKWQSTIQVSGEGVEYLSHDGTSVVYGVEGSVAPTVTPGSATATRIITGITILPTDMLIVEIKYNGVWVDSALIYPSIQQGSKSYGVQVYYSGGIRVDFGGGGVFTDGATYGANSTIGWGSSYRWRVRKTSGGNLAQVPPLVKVQARKTANHNVTANVTNINFESEMIDTHNAWDGTTFTCPVSGWYRISLGAFACSSGSGTFIPFIGGVAQNNNGLCTVTSANYFDGSTEIYLTQGQLLTMRMSSTIIITPLATYGGRIEITRIGS